MPLWSVALPRPPVPRPHVLRAVAPILAAMRDRPTHAGPLVAEGLRAARSLGSKDRPIAGDLLLGLIRHERALARIDPDPLTAWLRLAEGGPPDLPDPDDAYAVALSLPNTLASEWWDRLGPDAATALAVRLAGRAPVALRVLRDPVDLPVPHRRDGLAIVLDARVNLHVVPAYQEGRVEIQDLGSQAIIGFVAEVLLGRGARPPATPPPALDPTGALGGARGAPAPAAEGRPLPAAPPGAAGHGGLLRPGDVPDLRGARILDLCAGAGGKSLALAALGAEVQAWDVRRAALAELDKRARRAGLAVRIGPPKGAYDLVLVDAPCSGTGVLRRHPENRWKLRFPTDIQAKLLADARAMAPLVVYATCSLARAENEDLVRTVAEPFAEATVWPDADREGFYMAAVRGG